jgi:hypothetical protein
VKIILFDKTSRDIPGFAWAIGSFRPGWTRIGAKSWDEAAEAIGSVFFEHVCNLGDGERSERLTELQIWGHGQPGEPLIAGKPMTPAFIRRVQVSVNPDSLVWFRSCSVFFGATGRVFAERTANELSCRIAGHTHVIGPWQSGLCTQVPGELWKWGTHNGAWTKYKSGWREPRTIACLRMAVPPGW